MGVKIYNFKVCPCPTKEFASRSVCAGEGVLSSMVLQKNPNYDVQPEAPLSPSRRIAVCGVRSSEVVPLKNSTKLVKASGTHPPMSVA